MPSLLFPYLKLRWDFPTTLKSIGHFRVPKPLFKNEAKYKTFLVKMILICVRIKNYFYINSFALSLALRQRLGANRKWPIQLQAPVSVAKARKKTVSLINLVTLPFS